ncbi:MAG: hypothetical protein EOP86_12835 [Verrucomicrobiaceae bacterium]|nr:MAG: hypothetical protein EOP86_12835 [Verrucomicrobiaceae bacterium]
MLQKPKRWTAPRTLAGRAGFRSGAGLHTSALICLWLSCAGCASPGRKDHRVVSDGILVLKLTVSPAGTVTHVEVIKSDAPDALLKKGMAIAEKMKFPITIRNGHPVGTQKVLPVYFRRRVALDRNRPTAPAFSLPLEKAANFQSSRFSDDMTRLAAGGVSPYR